MTKVEIDNHTYKVVRTKISEGSCNNCSFKWGVCPRSDEWPWYPLCCDYETENTFAHFRIIF